MSATAKGVAVGAANLFVIAVLITLSGDSTRIAHVSDPLSVFLAIMIMGSLFAVLGGAAVGWLAGRIAVHRSVVLVALAVGAVVAIGLMTQRSWIVYAAPPTVFGALVLSGWTRRRPDEEPPVPLTPVASGIALAIAALIVVGAVLGVLVRFDYDARHDYHHHRPTFEGFGVALVIWLGGIVPTLAAGGIAGAIAGRLARAPVWLRVLALVTPAAALVIAVAAIVHQQQYVTAALAPILPATLGLEHLTRYKPAIPLARVHGE